MDWLYPLFRRFLPRQTFYYAACGGGNTLLSILIFFVTYNFVLRKQLLHTPLVTLSPHIAAMVISFLLTFPLGFYMARYVVFSGSALRGRQQLMRYMLSTAGSVLLNYVNLKIMVDLLHFYPTIAQIINTAIVITFSYMAQKHFAFRKKKRAES
ncbi:MAG: GtrA family protein [Chitinophagaceae bacterium]|nr:GtrA family protein [Chitinophagaceae bacterium]